MKVTPDPEPSFIPYIIRVETQEENDVITHALTFYHNHRPMTILGGKAYHILRAIKERSDS